MLRKVILLSLLLTAPLCFAKGLHSFHEVSRAVEDGRQIRVVIDFNKCETYQTMPGGLIARLEPSSIIIKRGDHLSFSEFHFTTQHPAFPGTPLYESSRFNLNNHNDLTINSNLLTPGTFEPKNAEFHATCKLGEAAFIFEHP